MRTSSVLVIGGGIIGSVVAYFLKQMAPGMSVTVVEMDSTYQRSCTRLSASAIRQQFNLGINAAMSRFTYDFFKNATTHLSVDGKPVELGFTECPYLVLAGVEGVERLAAGHRRQVAAGARVAFLTSEQLTNKIPWLKTEGIGAGCLGLEGEGWLDPWLALQAVRGKAEHLGVIYLNAEIVRIKKEGNRIIDVLASNGNTLQADIVVNAAGAQAGKVSTLAGAPLPIESRRRPAFVFRAANPPKGFTNLVDPTFMQRGVYTRPYGEHFMSVTSPAPSEDPDTDNLDVDYSLFENIVKPALARRVKGFEKIELVKAWAGFYEMNAFDQNAVLGPHPELPNFFFACGLSGHGVMHSAAIGRGLAELIVSGKYQTLDLSPFYYSRIANNKPLDDKQASEHREVAAAF